MSAKYKEEKRKRKELEERIKMLERGSSNGKKSVNMMRWIIAFVFFVLKRKKQPNQLGFSLDNLVRTK